MAEPTVISWTPANWITVVLMVSLAFLLVVTVSKVVKQRQATA